MKKFSYLLIGLASVTVAFAAYVRLAPTNSADWHVPIDAESDTDLPGGAIRVRSAEPDALARIDTEAKALARTRVLAGSVDEGRITYITRSALWGFPDFTTVEYTQGQLKAYARLRFGQSDLGVNARRLDALLEAIE